MLIKICGITRVDDALAAQDAGATAVGFVFWPRSPRAIAPEAAAGIGSRLGGAMLTVGVFVDETLERVTAVAEAARLDAVQLHGHEPIEYCAAVGRAVFKACRATDDVSRYPDAVRVLLDADDPVRRGGTGRTVDWRRARAIAASRPVVLSGGLTPANVGEAIRVVRPVGVDVSSGVEREPGVKDAARIRAFVAAVRHAVQAL